MLYALILAGGVGSRLWPKSRNSMPKQFLNLTGTETLIQTSVRRIEPLIPLERIFVATGERYVGLVEKQLSMLPKENIIAEMSGKNTAPAIGLGALYIAQVDPTATMVVLTADHIIPDEAALRQAIQAAANVAAEGRLVTLGITPTGPETGFGYIHRGEVIGHYQDLDVFQVKAFLEKPKLAAAQRFFESNNYYWNSGMFIWQTATLFENLRLHMPALYRSLESLRIALFNQPDHDRVAEIWSQINPQSIDFGLMEKAAGVAVVPLDAGWNDVGSWFALYDELVRESGENVVINADHIGINSKGLLIQGDGKLVATIGLENMAIIQTESAILICPLDQTQAVKMVVERLKADKKETFL